MEELGIVLKPWVLAIGVILFATGLLFIFTPGFTTLLSRILDRTVSIRQWTKMLEAKIFNIDHWIIKNMKWLGVVALSDAVILLVMYYIYLR